MTNDRVEIIAEIAQGYEGDKKLSELLAKGATAAGADSVKFQLVYADELATPDYMYYDLFRSLEMDSNFWKQLCSVIHDNGKKVYFDVFGLMSLEVASEIDADGVKLSTTEFYNNRLFDAALSMFDVIFLSVGGVPIEDVDKKMSMLSDEEINKICLMYGFQAEPTPLDQNNLVKLRMLKQRFPKNKIGFMDHSDGGLEDAYYLPIVSLGVGIDVIEKHITLDRELEIEDYISGLTPSAFSKFIELIRKYEPVLGEETFDLSDREKEYREKATKSVVAVNNIKQGQVVTQNDIALKRSSIPITSKSILELEDVLGKKIKCNIDKHNPILKDQI